MKLTELIDRHQISSRTREIALAIRSSYPGIDHPPIFWVLMEGAGPFAGELLSHFPIADVEHVTVKSYKKLSGSRINISASEEQFLHIKGRRVIVIEDIVDTGRTLDELRRSLSAWGAVDVKAVALLAKRKHPLLLEVGFMLHTPKFVVGYGMDYDDQFRDLKDIYTLDL